MLDTMLILFLLAASTAELSNERITVSGPELEKHWQIDCRRLVQQVEQLVAAEPANIDALVRQRLIADAGKCAIIYNTRDTGRTVDCPDYNQIRQQLERAGVTPIVDPPTVPDTTDCKSQ